MENEVVVPAVEAKEIGITEMSELIDGLVLLAKGVKEVMADGKVTLADLGVALTLVENQAVLVAAFTKLGDIKTEVKDMSIDEIQMLMAKLIQAAKDLKAA